MPNNSPSITADDKFNAADGQRSVHLARLAAWLPADISMLRDNDWSPLSSQVIGYLIKTVGEHPLAPAMALIAASLCEVDLVANSQYNHCKQIWACIRLMERQRDKVNIDTLRDDGAWRDFANTVTDTSTWQGRWQAYRCLSENYLPRFLARIDSVKRDQLEVWAIPPMPISVRYKFRNAHAIRSDAEERRKDASDVLAPNMEILVEIVWRRKHVMKALRDAIRRERDRVLTEGLPCPHAFTVCLTDSVMQEQSDGSSTIVERPISLKLRLWNRKSWILAHSVEFRDVTINGYTRGHGRIKHSLNETFVECDSPAADLLWLGDLIQMRQFQSYSDTVRPNDDDYRCRKDYAAQLGSANGLRTSRPGVLAPGGPQGNWLAGLSLPAGKLIFEMEALYRGILYGSVAAIIGLQTGPRISELLQISESRYAESRLSQNPDERIVYQMLLPKGAHADDERQPYIISRYAQELLDEIASDLRAAHGTIPVIYPASSLAQRDRLSPEPYLFQWATISNNRHGMLQANDILVLLKVVFHGLEFTTPAGEPIRITQHLLRHVMATQAAQYGVPLKDLATIALHHRLPSGTGEIVPKATEYYTRMPAEQRENEFRQRQRRIEDQYMPTAPLPEEADLVRLDTLKRDFASKCSMLLPTTFGTCNRQGGCHRAISRELCLGCTYHIADEKYLDRALQSRGLFETKLRLMEQSARSDIDIIQVQRQIRDLDRIIHLMKLKQSTPHRPDASSREEVE